MIEDAPKVHVAHHSAHGTFDGLNGLTDTSEGGSDGVGVVVCEVLLEGKLNNVRAKAPLRVPPEVRSR